MGHARALLALSTEAPAGRGAQKMVKGGLSVRATEHMVKRMNQGPAQGGKGPSVAAPPWTISDGWKASCRSASRRGWRSVTARKKGRLVIHYHSLDELDGILERIR